MTAGVRFLVLAALVSCTAPRGPAPVPRAAPQAETAELDDFVAGSDLLYKGKRREALRKLRAFLREQPSSPYADDAQYAIGEAYYRAGDFERAVRELAEVPRRYPDGDHVPTALLRQAFAFEALGNEAAARRLLETLVREHGSSPQAGLGRRKLAALGE